MGKQIKVTESSGQEAVPVRRRNVQGALTTAVSITLPKELVATIKGLEDKYNKSRSLVITELIEKGLEHNG